jgi:hypothetical protein
MASNAGGATKELVMAGIGTAIVVGVLDGVNTTGSTILATLVAVGKYSVMAVAIIFAYSKL